MPSPLPFALERRHPRFPASVPATLEFQVSREWSLARERPWKATFAVSVREASLGGMSFVFLDDTPTMNGAADEAPPLELKRELPAAVRVQAGRTGLAVSGHLVWFKRLPGSRRLLFAGIRLRPELATEGMRREYADWVLSLGLNAKPAPEPIRRTRAPTGIGAAISLWTGAPSVPPALLEATVSGPDDWRQTGDGLLPSWELELADDDAGGAEARLDGLVQRIHSAPDAWERVLATIPVDLVVRARVPTPFGGAVALTPTRMAELARLRIPIRIEQA